VRVEATKDGVAKVQSWVDGAVIEIEMKAGAVAMLRADSGAAEVTVAGPK
jgi:hypothetical protein